MRNIADILNAQSSPTQALGAAPGMRPASSPTDSSNGESFGQVVNRLNSQSPNVSSGQSDLPETSQQSSTPAGATSEPASSDGSTGGTQITLFDQIDIHFTETIQNGASDQSQVQQSLAALASAFQQLAGFLLSNPGVSADQVENQIVTATQGAVSPDAAKALVAAVQSFLQSLPPSQKSLLSDEATRQNLFNQLFQNLGSALTGAKPDSTDKGSVTESFDFQMAFGTTALLQGVSGLGGAASTGDSASVSGEQFFEASVSASQLNDNQLQTSISSSVLDEGPLSGGLAALTQQEGQLLTNLAGTQIGTGQTPTSLTMPGLNPQSIQPIQNGQAASGTNSNQTPKTGGDLAGLLSQAQAGAVKFSVSTGSQATLSADELNKIAQTDFNQIFNSMTKNIGQAPPTATENIAFEIPPVTPAETLQAPTLGMPSVLGGSSNAAINTSILSTPAVVALQNTADVQSTAQAGAIQRIFDEISASFHSLTVTSAIPAAVTPPVTLPGAQSSPTAGSGQEEQTSTQTPLDASPQLLNSTPASGNSDQTQDVQTFQNFLRSSVVVDSQTNSFSVDETVVSVSETKVTTSSQTPAPTTGVVSGSSPSGVGRLDNLPGIIPAPTETGTDTTNSSGTASVNVETQAALPVGTDLKETVTASELFTNTVVVGENVRPVVAQASTSPAVQNGNQALPTDPNLSAVQSINPVLAQGINSVSTVAKFSALADEYVKDQDALSGIPTSPSITADSGSLAGAATFVQTVQANAANAANSPINAAGVILQFAEQLSQHASQVHTVSRLSFQLVPESLGRVTIQIALVDQSVSARIVVTNPDVQSSLQNHLVDLKAALSQAGLQIDQLQVQVQGGSSNLLGQYYQYQQEGFSYGSSVGFLGSASSIAENDENTGFLAPLSQRNSLVNLLA